MKMTLQMTMKKLLLAAVLALPFAAIPAAAQLTGPSLINRVSMDLKKQTTYRVETREGKLYLVDGAGTPVVAMEENSRQTVIISGTVADLSHLSAESKNRAMAHIALFNFSSPVGTLSVDEAGRVTMMHRLNSKVVSTGAIAQVAELCGDVVRQESQTLMQ